jgi:hypothetical protein
MKKLMIAATAALCATVSFAELASANIVGYNTVNINKEYTLLSIAFDEVDGSAIDIQKAFPYGEGMTKGLAFSEADNIQIMTDDGDYEIYFLSNGKYGKGGASYNEALDGKWSLMGQNAATEAKFPVGKGAWYLSRSKTGTVKFINPITK